MKQNTLFESLRRDVSGNVLPKNGCALYYPEVFNANDSTQLFSRLHQSLKWNADRVMMFGKLVTMRRKVAWVGDPHCTYTYSGVKKIPQEWTPELLQIKAALEHLSDAEFNSCLVNLYHDGDDGMGWHSDDEKELDAQSPIASLSLGARRKFAFRHKQDQTIVPIFLDHGSALIMHTPTQNFWQHALLKTKKVSEMRINLTFRKITRSTIAAPNK